MSYVFAVGIGILMGWFHKELWVLVVQAWADARPLALSGWAKFQTWRNAR